MRVKVFLADIFDLTAPTAMDKRMEYAFGADGQDFWERFFPCNKTHPNDKIIYLFTEHQMQVFYNWWTEKYKKSGMNIKKNMDFSRQKLFQAAMPVLKGRYSDIVRACYVKKVDYDKQLVLQRVLFGMPLGIEKQKYIDFFDGKFRNDPPESFSQDQRREKIIELLELRPMIENEFDGPRENEIKWLCYLGPIVFDSPFIEYCDNNTGCPFVK